MMLNSRTIGDKIAEARKKNNLSQAGLAQQVSISPQAVGKWERGESMPDITMLNRLGEILGVDLNYFSGNAPTEDARTTAGEIINRQKPEPHPAQSKRRFDWNWDMSKGNWVDADFSGLKNLKEKFSSSNMKNCKFRNSDLSELVLGKNNIELCDFSSSDLRNSQIQSSNLLNNQFNNCSFIDARLVHNNIGKCSFDGADFSGAEITDGFFENNTVDKATWKFTMFKNMGLGDIVFEGRIEDCHFENCAFYNVKFENTTILNSFFKYNRRFKKVQFINCRVDKITHAFLKNNLANMSGIAIIE